MSFFPRESITSTGDFAGPLIGRELDFDHLLESFDRISSCKGRPEVVVASGPMGSGKSFFVKRCMSNIVSRHSGTDCNKCMYASGKCNQIMCSQPFYCVAQALSSLCDTILTRFKVETWDIKQDVQDAVGDDGGILTELLPRARLIIGRQKIVSNVSGKERRARLKAVLRRFLRAITAHVDLIIHLDDLQWVDETSLDLVRALVTDDKIRGLLVIASFRNTMEDATQNDLDEFFANLESKNVRVSYIQIKPLLSQNVTDLVSQHLSVSADKASAMSRLIHTRTNGNAYFVVHFLSYMKTKGLLEKSEESMNWEWDDKHIENYNFPKTLEEMLVDELLNESEHVRHFLTQAAAIGFYFDNFTMNLISMGSCVNNPIAYIPSFKIKSTLNSSLELAVQRGYIHKVGNTGYQFTHDSLWEAAYKLLSKESRTCLHLNIGRVLFKNARLKKDQTISDVTKKSSSSSRMLMDFSCGEMSDFMDRHLCVIADQFNRGKDLITKDTERLDLISLNLRVAKLITQSSSWKLASDYLQTSIGLLGDDSWEEHYSINLQIYTTLAEVALSRGDFETLNKCVDLVIKQGKSINDTYNVYCTLIKSMTVQNGKMEEFMELGQSVLKQLGVPIKLNALTRLDGLKFRLSLKQILNSLSLDKLKKLPLLKDDCIIKAVDLLIEFFPITYGTDMYLVVVGTTVRLMFRYGRYPRMALAFLALAVYGFIPSKKDFFVQVAHRLDEIPNPFSILQEHGFIRHKTSPLHQSLDALWKGHELADRTGDLERAVYLGTFYASYSFYAGNPLDSVESKIMKFIEWMHDHNCAGNNLIVLRLYVQTIRCLQGNAACPFILDGDTMSLEEFLDHSSSSLMVASFLTLCRLQLCCIFNKFEEAGEILFAAPDVRKVRKNHFSNVRFTFYECFASANLARLTGMKSWRKRAQSSLKIIKSSLHSGNVNCLHMIPFLEAEIKLSEGKRQQAEAFYSAAIGTDCGSYLYDKALILEKSGEYFSKIGKSELASNCSLRSRTLYKSWGAHAKVNAMESYN